MSTTEERTVKLNNSGGEKTLTLRDEERGKRLFIDACSSCHLHGTTKDNHDVTLKQEHLTGAIPARDNIESLVNFQQEPTSYDGLDDISDSHPATITADLFPEMKNLTSDDLESIAGYILIQAKKGWG